MSQFYRVELKREKIVMQDDRVQYSYEPYGDGIIGKLNLPSFYESGGGIQCEADLREPCASLKRKGNSSALSSTCGKIPGAFSIRPSKWPASLSPAE